MTQTKRKTVTKEMEFLNLILSERDVFAGKYLGTLPFNKSMSNQQHSFPIWITPNRK